ncbi:dipeptidase [Pseudorhodobacter sp.]|uniref:dipeptidase n=1 Tax=Pseudorhodobacter sp. TaxID=1934400 RepID=UPI002647C361|nr:dipeptidase [Pseudorhodobacter sp.]MDN5788260.1 dipeptidase [Pseudorhodobacter sp.]
MANDQLPLIFDGHNDALLKLYKAGAMAATAGFVTGCEGALDVPQAKAGGFGGGFFAVYVPSPSNKEARMEEMVKPKYDLPLPEMVPIADAMPVVMAQAAILFDLERKGALKICRTVAELRKTLGSGVMAAIFHIEGAEAIDADLHGLDVLYQAGLRSIGPVWSRPTIFGHGVPFSFPSSPDTGPGLTEAGVRLVKRCNQLGIMLDLSHLNEAGFWDVVRHSDAPIVATHSNAHVICPHSRNLTDKQLAAIRESDGMVGLNFAVAFLRDDGRMLADVPLSQMLRHLDHLIEHLGEDRVGLGSDYDGATVPEPLTSVAGLPSLRQAMADHGYGAALIKKICHENWLRVLEKTWGG